MDKRIVTIVVVGLLSAPLLSVQAAGMRLYRYVNSAGNIEISHTLPSDRAAMGYEILDAGTGQVVQRVPRQLSPEELKVKQARDRRIAACHAEDDRVRTLYASETDIANAEKQSLKSLSDSITNARANLAQLQRQLEDLQKEAANVERTGGGVQAILIDSINQTEVQVKQLEQDIESRRRQQDETRNQYAEDLRIYREGACPELNG
ncbi:MAG: hypothetical protein R3E86_08200 [Pseudomonadales bacterium]